MHVYTWYQWLTFFYLYCFFGWIFESSYVSILKRRFVNRGFLRIPMLPLYGSGAVMMLVVSEPFQDSLLLTWVSGVIGATILEYVTGWAMEQLFKVRYWDYSNQKFNLHGYICLSSSIAWGFLTIFMTHVIHKPIERAVLSLPVMWDILFVAVVTVVFTADAIVCTKEALAFGRSLEAARKLRQDLDMLRVQTALLRMDAEDRLHETRTDLETRLAGRRADLEARGGPGGAAGGASLQDRKPAGRAPGKIRIPASGAFKGKGGLPGSHPGTPEEIPALRPPLQSHRLLPQVQGRIPGHDPLPGGQREGPVPVLRMGDWPFTLYILCFIKESLKIICNYQQLSYMRKGFHKFTHTLPLL
ncbi:predicted membrane protein [Clostridium sp. CAG:58]|nr:predicted membrane protein [Clostridium sp. CAG:58]